MHVLQEHVWSLEKFYSLLERHSAFFDGLPFAGDTLIFVLLSSFLIHSAMNYFELLLLELDLANDKNELSGFPSLLISQLKSHFEPK